MSDHQQSLIEKAVEGHLSPEEQREFNQVLKDQPELRLQFIKQCKVEGLLKASFGGLVEPQPEIRPQKSKPLTPALLLAATVLIGIALLKFIPPQSELDILEPGPIARIIHSDDPKFYKGMHINPGPIALNQGNVHLVMDSGVELIFSGQSEARLDHAMKVHLDKGKASVKVPPPAIGFKLTTNQMSVHDLGTSFGVEAGPSKNELHVFEGKVKVTPATLASEKDTEVLAGQAISLHQGKEELQLSTYLNQKFPTVFSTPQPIEKPFVHYTFNRELLDFGTHPTRFDGMIIKKPEFPNQKLLWINGKFQDGLHLNRNYWIETPYTGVSGSKPRTVSLWLKVMPGQRIKKAASIIAWGLGKGSQKKWQVMLDGGANGTLRVSLGDGHVSGSTDLQDGRWHHVCAVYLGGEKADVRTHLRLYVDGKLEKLNRTRLQTVDTGGETPMVIGQNLTHYNKKDHIFKGLIDELYIFEEALHPNQIDLLYRENALPEKLAF